MKGSITYRRLGDYIIQRREKNNGYDVPIRGVSREGFINPKQQDADISLYNVFYKYDFVFNPARMELNSIALNEEFDKGICSSLYEIFYIKDTNELEPLYLNLLLKREHFTRFCNFVGWGSVREYCRFADISEYIIPVPDIDEQRKIVRHYNAIRTRIENNKKTIAKLEEAAQALYRKMFVDGIDKENLPEGWRLGKLGEVCDITDGTHDSPKPTKEGYPLITSVHLEQWSINKENAYLISKQDYTKINERSIVEIGDILYSMIGTIGSISLVSEKVDFAVKNMAIIKSSKNKEIIEYIFIFFKSKEMKDIISSNLCGSTQNYITLSILRDIRIKIPTQEMIRNFHKNAYKIFKLIILYNNEIKKLTELQSLLLAKMGR